MSPPTPVDKDPYVASIRRFIEQQVDEPFLDRFGAHAVGIGRRRKGPDGKRYEPCLILYVEPGRKGQPGITHIDNPLQFVDPVTGKHVKIRTDVVEATVARMDGVTPVDMPKSLVPGGVSFSVIGHDELPPNTATLGGWAWDLEDHSPVFLSNMHTLGNEPGLVIYHPGFLPKQPRIPLGRVKRGTMEFDGRCEVDCAIGEVDEHERVQFEVLEIGPAIMAIGEPSGGMKVEKTGQASGHTHGRIDDDGWRGRVPDLTGKQRMFSNCVAIEPTSKKLWAQQGDSGSLVFEERSLGDGTDIKTCVGLHFASTLIGDKWYGVACRIHRVFGALHLETLPRGVLASFAKSLNGDAGTGKEFAMLLAFRERCEKGDGGRRLLKFIDTYRGELATLLARNVDLRSAAVQVLRPIFAGTLSLDEALGRTVGAETLAPLSLFLDRLETIPGLKVRAAIPDFRAFAESAKGKTLRDALTLTDAPAFPADR